MSTEPMEMASAVPPPAVDPLEHARARIVHRAFRVEGVGQTAVGVTFLSLLAWWAPNSWILPVVVAYGLVLGARIAQWAAYETRVISAELALRTFTIGATAQGVIWAAMIGVFFGRLDLEHQLILASLLVAHNSGVVAALATSTKATAGYLLPVGGALVATLWLDGRLEARIFSTLLALYVPVALVLARQIREGAIENIRLRFQAEAREKALESSNARLAREEARYRRLFESSEDAMWVMRDNRFVMANEAACRILGYSTAEAFAEIHPGDISPPQQAGGTPSFDEAERMMSEAYRKGYHRFEWLHMRSDGTVFPAEVTLTVLEREPVSELFAVVRDISDRKAVEDELRRMQSEADRANRAKSDFLATMSHEIRTPMNAVLGMAELLQSTELDEEQSEFVATIASSGDSLLSLINDILDFSKIEAGRLELASEEFDLKRLVGDVSRLLANTADLKGIDLRLEDEGIELRQVIGDPTRLRQMLVNLLGNAIKFTEQGHVTLRASCRRIAVNRAAMQIEVEDTGIGIDKSAQAQLFEPFVQADKTTTRHFGGTGLGLAITRRLAEAMGGSVELQSAPGEGSTFSIRCELDCRAETQGEGAPQAPADDNHRLERGEQKMQGRVLVVEDALPNQKLAEKMLGLMGLDVEIAENGQVGVDMYRSNDYDLVLMDLQMPVMDGYDATRGIRKVQEDRQEFRPICAVTANVTPDDQARCRAVGMDGFLGKPYNFSQLREKVEALLNQTLQLK